MEKKISNGIFTVRQLTTVGLLSSICIFMGLTGFGFIPLPFMKATVMQIPVIIGAILEGPLVGAAIGLVFGLSSMYQNMTTPTLFSPIFMNPLVAILPRVLISIVSYYVYKLIKTKFKKDKLAYGLSALCGTLTNTIGVLGLTCLLFSNKYAQLINIPVSGLPKYIATIVGTNGLCESIVSVIIVIPVVASLKKISKRN